MATKMRTDEQIQRDVLAELKWDPRVQPNEIGVVVKDGIVTKGEAEKEEAERAAWMAHLASSR